jgi:hypothetical protein
MPAAGAIAAAARQLSCRSALQVRKLAAELLVTATALEPGTCQLLLEAGGLDALLQMVRDSPGAGASAAQLLAGASAAALLQNLAFPLAAKEAMVQAGAATVLLQPLRGPAAAPGSSAGELQEAALRAIRNLCRGEPV